MDSQRTGRRSRSTPGGRGSSRKRHGSVLSPAPPVFRRGFFIVRRRFKTRFVQTNRRRDIQSRRRGAPHKTPSNARMIGIMRMVPSGCDPK